MTIDQTARVKLERASLGIGGVAFVLGGLVGLAFLRGHTPLFGRGSIGDIAAFSAAVVGGLACLVVIGLLGDNVLPWHRELSRFRRVVDLIGLMLMFASISLLVVMALFQLFSNAFRTIRFDEPSGAFLVAVTCAAVGYIVASATSQLSTSSLTVYLSIFVFAGAIFSAMTSVNEYWWRMHFSTLGTAIDASGIAFNVTLILAGLVLVTLSDFIVYDLSLMVRYDKGSTLKVTIVRIGFIVFGVCLAGIGVFPESFSHLGHIVSTYAAITVVVLLMMLMIALFPRVRRAFWAPTLLIAAMLGAAGYLHRGIWYLNITAFEMIAVALVLVWLFLLIRAISSVVTDLSVEDTDRWEREIQPGDTPDQLENPASGDASSEVTSDASEPVVSVQESEL